MKTFVMDSVRCKDGGNFDWKKKQFVFIHQRFSIDMEDAHATILKLDGQRWSNWSYFGIFDGHAGFRTAMKAAEKLHSSVLSSLNNLVMNNNNSKSNSPISSSQLNFHQFEAAIKEAYFKFDSDWREENRVNNPGRINFPFWSVEFVLSSSQCR